MTPLHLAVKRNNPSIVFILLSDEHDQQADPNLVDRNGQTPLHMAATVGYVDVIRVILQANLDEPCDPTIVDAQQLTAYQIAKANHHETCAKLIDEYEQGWIKLSPRRETPRSINEQEIKPTLTNPTQQFHKHDDDESSDETSSNASSHSSGQLKRPPNQWPGHTVPSAGVTKPEGRTLADLIKNNPLQSDLSKTNVSKQPTNQTISSLMHNIPLQPPETSTSKPVIRKFLFLIFLNLHSYFHMISSTKTTTIDIWWYWIDTYFTKRSR
jgi:hypothetical protein